MRKKEEKEHGDKGTGDTRPFRVLERCLNKRSPHDITNSKIENIELTRTTANHLSILIAARQNIEACILK